LVWLRGGQPVTTLQSVVVAVAAVSTDSNDPSTWSLHGVRVQQSVEEVIDLGDCLALMAAVTFRLLVLLDAYLAAKAPTLP
jgi:hypothetical protein